METKNRTKVYNVIILDKSGSMSSIAKQAIDGVNETIASIKRGQELHPEQDNQLTLVAFCGCELRKIYEQTPIGEVRPITTRDYRPCCMTPLYDAIGNTITAVHRMMEHDRNAIASVTIITDGYENASKEYTHTAIRSLIEAREAIDNLIDPMSNTLNEYISKIKRCFKTCIIDEKLADNYCITGKRGEPYRVTLDSSFVILPRAVTNE